MNKLLACAASLGVALCIGSADAAKIKVPSDFATIQGAVDNSNPNDTNLELASEGVLDLDDLVDHVPIGRGTDRRLPGRGEYADLGRDQQHDEVYASFLA